MRVRKRPRAGSEPVPFERRTAPKIGGSLIGELIFQRSRQRLARMTKAGVYVEVAPRTRAMPDGAPIVTRGFRVSRPTFATGARMVRVLGTDAEIPSSDIVRVYRNGTLVDEKIVTSQSENKVRRADLRAIAKRTGLPVRVLEAMERERRQQ